MESLFGLARHRVPALAGAAVHGVQAEDSAVTQATFNHGAHVEFQSHSNPDLWFYGVYLRRLDNRYSEVTDQTKGKPRFVRTERLRHSQRAMPSGNDVA